MIPMYMMAEEGHAMVAVSNLSVNSFSLVATDPRRKTEMKYRAVVVRVAASVPMGIERWVSFSEAERFEPAMIPVTAGKKRPTSALKCQCISPAGSGIPALFVV